jgi:serine protease
MRRPVLLLAVLGTLALPGAALAQQQQDVDSSAEPTDIVGAPTFGQTAEEALFDDVYVDLEDDASEADVAEVARIAGVSLAKLSSESDVDKIEVAHVDRWRIPVIIDLLSRTAHVEHAEQAARVQAYFVPNDPLYNKQWHLKKVGAESAWGQSCGMGVTVAVVDTGVACYDKSPFMKGSDLQGTRCVDGWSFVDDSSNAADDQGHGTHVAGTIAQTTNNGKGVAGLAFCASLMPVKVLNKFGWGTTANVAQGIRWAADHGAQVINLSLGGPIKSQILEDAVKHARAKGAIVVAAAGNSGKSVGWPAAYPEVVAVSATDSNDKIAWFSSRGPEVDIGAPGVSVTQQTICDNGRNKCEQFGTFNGTSMASPHVAGAAAMIVGLGVTDPDAVEAALKASAEDKGDKNLYGAGRLDASAAANRVLYTHLGLRIAALFALFALVGRAIKKSGSRAVRSKGALVTAMLAGTGLLPIAGLLGLTTMSGPLRPIVELAMRPLGEWDLVFSAGLHKYLLLANAGPAIGATLLLYGVKRLRPLVGGLAIGSAALLTQMAISGDVSFALGSIGLRVFAVVNAAVCFWIAKAALDEKH